MGLFDMFGVGGGGLTIQPTSAHVMAGQTLTGQVVFTGGKRAQNITAVTLRLTQELRTMQMTNQGPQPRTDSRDICPSVAIAQNFSSQPGQPTPIPFQLMVPAGLPSSTPQQVTYHLRASADIAGEVDPGASIEVQITGTATQQPMMPNPMMGKMPNPMMGQMPNQMMPGQMMPNQMMPGMMPNQMMPGQMMPNQMMPGQIQIAQGTQVHAMHPSGQMAAGRVIGFENGYYRVDWQDPQLGASSYVMPQQIQVDTGMHGHHGAPQKGHFDQKGHVDQKGHFDQKGHVDQKGHFDQKGDPHGKGGGKG